MACSDTPNRCSLWPILAWMFLLGACTMISGGETSPTLTTQAERSHTLATQMALSLRATFQAASLQATASVQAAQDLLGSAREWPVLAQHTFDRDVDAWQLEAQSNEFGASSWRLTDGQYLWNLKSFQGVAWWSTPDMKIVSDFYASVQAQQLEGPTNAQFGLIFRRDPDYQYYLLQITPQRQYSIYLRYAEEWHELLPWTASDMILTDQPNRLAVIGQGDTFYCFINDQFITQFSDERLPEGDVGLLVGLSEEGQEGDWAFDDFVVHTP